MSKFLSFIFVFIFLFNASALAQLDINRLSVDDINKVESLLGKLDPLIQERRQKNNLASLTLNELYTPLTESQKEFFKNFENLDANA